MARPRITRCRSCNAEVGSDALSWTKQCPACGATRLAENVHGLATHSGPAFDRWRRAMAACVGGILIDESKGQA